MSDVIAISPILVAAATGILVMALDLLSGRDADKGFLGWVTAIGMVAAGAMAWWLWPGGRAVEAPYLVGMVELDAFGAFFGVLVALAGAAAALLSVGHNPEQGILEGDPYPLMAFSVTGAMLFVVATDLILLFLGLEIMSLALYVLAAGKRTSPFSMEAGVKYFLLGGLASGFLLFGAAFLYGAAGSLDFVAVGRALGAAGAVDGGLARIALVMVVTAIGFKIAAVPFHFWTPDVYEGAPTPVTAFMAGAVKAAGFAVLARLLLTVWGTPQFSVGWASPGGILLALAILSMVVGNLLGIVQTNVKRILAYSSIAHAGYILLGMYAVKTGAGGVELGSSVPFYLATYVVATVGAFGVLALLSAKGHEDASLDSIAGLGRRHPLLAVLLTVCVLSLAGIPPLAGFMGKFTLFQQVLAVDPSGNVVWVTVAVLNSLVALYYYLRIVLFAYFREPEGQPAQAIPSTPGYVAVVVMAVLALALGILPGRAMEASKAAAQVTVPAPAAAPARAVVAPARAVVSQVAPAVTPDSPRRLLKGTPYDPAQFPGLRHAMPHVAAD